MQNDQKITFPGQKITFPGGADEAVCPDYSFECLVLMCFLCPNLRSWLCCAFMQPDTVTGDIIFMLQQTEAY
jgi:hypothetical protein